MSYFCSCFSFKYNRNNINKDCPVCLDNLVDILNTSQIIAFHCGHVICSQCCNKIESDLINRHYYKLKCPVCREFCYYTTLKVDYHLKCMRCLKSLLELVYANKLLVHLKCGHCYCFNCAAGLLYKPMTNYYKCLICNNYFTVYPLFLV